MLVSVVGVPRTLLIEESEEASLPGIGPRGSSLRTCGDRLFQDGVHLTLDGSVPRYLRFAVGHTEFLAWCNDFVRQVPVQFVSSL
eukprot:4205333-Pyramimonas_sp.AAC.1